MKSITARAVPAAGKGRRTAVAAAVAVAGLAGAGIGVGTGIPGVMAGTRSAPDSPVPPGWPAAKSGRMRAEDQLRQAAAGRPLLPPPALPPLEVASPPREPAAQSAGRVPQRETAGGAVTDPGAQAALMPGIVPLTAGGPFSPSRFLGTNLWNGPVGGRWEVVQAGGVPAAGRPADASAARAGLFVYTRSPDPASAAAPEITGVRAPSPDPAGMFTIRRARDGVLTLSLPGSRAPYRFTVATLRFSR